MRGPLARPPVPLARTRPEQFSDVVHDAVRRVARHLTDTLEDEDVIASLARIEVVVDDVPPERLEPSEHVVAAGELAEVALGRVRPGTGTTPARLVVHRRPVELRAEDDEELAGLVQDVVVELLAELFDLDLEDVDPDADADDGED